MLEEEEELQLLLPPSRATGRVAGGVSERSRHMEREDVGAAATMEEGLYGGGPWRGPSMEAS